MPSQSMGTAAVTVSPTEIETLLAAGYMATM
jgi:hypothetical protein